MTWQTSSRGNCPTFTGYGPPPVIPQTSVTSFVAQDDATSKPNDDYWKTQTDFFLRSIHNRSPSPPPRSSNERPEKVGKRSRSRDFEDQGSSLHRFQSKSPLQMRERSRDSNPPMENHPSVPGRRSPYLQKSPVYQHHDPFSKQDNKHRNPSEEKIRPKRRRHSPGIEDSHHHDRSTNSHNPVSTRDWSKERSPKRDSSLSDVSLADIDESSFDKNKLKSFSRHPKQNRIISPPDRNVQSPSKEDPYDRGQRSPVIKEPQRNRVQSRGRSREPSPTLVRRQTSLSDVSSPSPEPRAHADPHARPKQHQDKEPSREKNQPQHKSLTDKDSHFHRRSGNSKEPHDANRELFHSRGRSPTPEKHSHLGGREYYQLDNSSQYQIFGKRDSLSPIQKEWKDQNSRKLSHGPSPEEYRRKDYDQLDNSQYSKQTIFEERESTKQKESKEQSSKELFHNRYKSPSTEKHERLTGRECLQPGSSQYPKENIPDKRGSASPILKASLKQSEDLLCICCLSRSHTVGSCPKFEQLSIEKRRVIVENLSVDLCVLCLEVGHLIEECALRKSANHRGPEVCCGRLHSLLHTCDKEKTQV